MADRRRDGRPSVACQVVGSDGAFVEAVVLFSDRLEHPAAVRFAWNQLAAPNLVNGAVLPASPFHSGL